MTNAQKETRLKTAAPKVADHLIKRGNASGASRMLSAIASLDTRQSAILYDAIVDA